MLSADAERRGVKLTVNGSAGEILVSASMLELQQVLMNLTLNAIQEAGKSPEGTVEISFAEHHDGEVMIAVDDNGPGLDAVLHETVFQPFVTSKAKGTESVSRSQSASSSGIWGRSLSRRARLAARVSR